MYSSSQNSAIVRAAALRGVPQAQLIYGQMLLDAKTSHRDEQAALHWFERAALGGELMAVNMVGRCLDQGWGTPASQQLALPWFRHAAERGLDWGMYNLATLLLLGKGGIAIDRAQAFDWLARAASLGHVKSMNLLGGFYEDGWIVTRDLAKARTLYRGAALGGDFRGQFNFARFLLDEGDWVGALSWLRKLPDTATPAFIEKASRFLLARKLPLQLSAFVRSMPRATLAL